MEKQKGSMKTISQTRKMISYILKLTVIISVVTGTVLSYFAGRSSFMGGSTVFMYFTIQSNIVIAVICAVGGFLLIRNKKISKAWYIVKLAGTVSITLTGVVFVVLLVPLLGDDAWNVQNTLTHAVVPAAAVVDFFVAAPASETAVDLHLGQEKLLHFIPCCFGSTFELCC